MVERSPSIDTRARLATGHRQQTEHLSRPVPGLRSQGQAETAGRPATEEETQGHQQTNLRLSEEPGCTHYTS